MGCDRFRKQYAAYAARTGVTSGVEHRAGQAIEVDRAGKTIRIVDPVTGDESGACLFVGVLPTGRKQRTRWRTGSTAGRRGPTAMSRTRATGVPSRTRTPGPPWTCASAPAQSRLCSTHRLLPSTAANQYSTNETDPPGRPYGGSGTGNAARSGRGGPARLRRRRREAVRRATVR